MYKEGPFLATPLIDDWSQLYSSTSLPDEKKNSMFLMADFLFLMKQYMTAGLLLNPRKQLSQ